MEKLINECMYRLGTIKISNFLNNLLHEVLGCAPTIIMIILFCKVNFLLLEEFPAKIIDIQHAKHMLHIIICGLVCSLSYASTLSHKRYDFRKNLFNVKFCSDFLYSLV